MLLKALNKWQLGWQGVLRCLNQWEPEWAGPVLSKPMTVPLPACRLSHHLSWGSIALFTLLRPLCRFWPIVLLHIPHSMHRETLFTYKIYLNMITSPSHIFLPSTWKVKEMTKLHVITGSDDSSAGHCNFNVVAGCKELKRMCIQKHFPGGTSGKEPTCQCRRCKRPGFDPWVGKIPLEEEMATHSSILAWRSYGQRSLAGYSPWDHKSWTRLKRLSTYIQKHMCSSFHEVKPCGFSWKLCLYP